MRAMVPRASRAAARGGGGRRSRARAPARCSARVIACGVCRTDLHIVDGELAEPKLPLVLGHQIVGEVVGVGAGGGALRGRRPGRDPVARLGLRRVPLLPLGPREPLRAGPASPATPATAATPSWPSPTSASASRCPPTPATEAAPLLCAGLIGYRALRMCGDAERLGLYGFGASAHIVCQVAAHQGRRVFAITRAGDADAQRVRARARRRVGGDRRRAARAARRGDHLRPGRASWCPVALRALAPGGVGRLRRHPHERHPLVPLRDLWGERQIRSVANLTRARRRGVPAARPRGRGRAPRPPYSAWVRQITLWPTCAGVGFGGGGAATLKERRRMADVTVKRTEDFEPTFRGGMLQGPQPASA